MRKYFPLWAWHKPIVGQSVGRGIGAWTVFFTGLAWPKFGIGVTTVNTNPDRQISTGKSVSDDPVKDIQ